MEEKMDVRTVCPQCGRVIQYRMDGNDKVQCPYCKRSYSRDELLKYGSEPVRIIREKERRRNILTAVILGIIALVLIVMILLMR
jgi:predicted nucleic acid-binding Zn ribbon protein